MNLLKWNSWRIINATLVALIMLATAATAHAATLDVSSASTQVTKGDIVTVTVIVNSSNEAINTAEGTLNFPTDVLQARSIDKSSSIFSIWVQDPSFSNNTGQVTFSGGLPTPGYQGNGGTILSISFVAKQAGTATLSLFNDDVRANDGMGTDILTSSGSLKLTVTNPVTAPAVTSPVTTTPTLSATTPTKPTSETTSPDTTPPTVTSPTFTYDFATGLLSVTAKAKDTGSVIESYSVSVDNGAPLSIAAVAFEAGYEIPVHTSGTHTALLTVTDEAGNKTAVSGSFIVPTIPLPTLDALPPAMNSGSQLSVQGTASSTDATVQIYISKDGATPSQFSATPDATGSFILLGPIVQKGNYEVWAIGTSVGGIVSAPSPKQPISVSDATVLSIGSHNFTLAEILLIFLGLSLASFLFAALGWYKVYTYHRGRKHAVAKIQKDVHHALGVFKDDMAAHLDMLEAATTTRKLTAAESKLREDMKSNLADLEKYIDGEVS